MKPVKRTPGKEVGGRKVVKRGRFEGALDSGPEAGNGMPYHPLENSLVLKTVFKYCQELEEVKRNRLVCKAWQDASEEQWTRLVKTLTIYQRMEDKKPEKNCTTLQQLMERCDKAKSPLGTVVPYRKFKLQGWLFDQQLNESLDNDGQDLRIERWFLRNIAPNLVTQLTLDQCRFPEELIVFEEQFLRAFPNLEKLSVLESLIGLMAGIKVTEKLANAYEQILDGQVIGNPARGYQHQNLRSLSVKFRKADNPVSQYSRWSPFLDKVANLEVLCLRGFEGDPGWERTLYQLFMTDLPKVAMTLKNLDILDFSLEPILVNDYSTFPNVADELHLRFLALEVLKLDVIAVPLTLLRDIRFISLRMPNLRELHLYQAPLSAPFHNFMSTAEMMNNLQELYLWGNFSLTMDFLRTVPNLRVLVWITSAYDEQYHGQRLFKVWTSRNLKVPFTLNKADILELGQPLPVMEHMSKLELDWAPASAAHWKKLGDCMPNLTSLKIKLSRLYHLIYIQEQWVALENLEFAHGSTLVAPEEELVKKEATFQKLKSFVWKGCLCTQELLKNTNVQSLFELERRMRSELPEKCEFPWHHSSQTSKEGVSWKDRTRRGSRICIRGKYEKAVLTKNRTVYA